MIISQSNCYKKISAIIGISDEDSQNITNFGSVRNQRVVPQRLGLRRSKSMSVPLVYLLSPSEMKKMTVINRRSINFGMPQQKAAPNLNDYVRFTTKNSLVWLKSTAESIKRQLNLNADVTPIVKSMLFSYVNNINRYLEPLKTIYSQNNYDASEKDLVFINFVDAFNKVLYNELKIFFHNLVDTYENILNPEKIDQTSDSVYTKTIQHKKDELNTLCLMNNICRPFPSFSDHFADFCSEVLKLTDEKLSEFINKLYLVLRGRADFYRLILGEKLFAEFDDKMLSLITGDLYDVREAVSVLRGLISQRFYPVENSDKKVEENTKASRMLIDIVDRTFSREDEETMSIHSSVLLKSLQDWANDFRNDVEGIIVTYTTYVTDAFEKHWDSKMREHTQALFRVLLRDDYDVSSYKL